MDKGTREIGLDRRRVAEVMRLSSPRRRPVPELLWDVDR
ncbi:MAG: hypothetical protein RLZ98_2089 [Pseudomonadota bacterium]|jgi:hypothetical protein